MSESLDRLAIVSDGADSVLDDLIEALTARLQAGEPVDLEEVARRHPEHAERLQRLLPALVMMADLRDSSPRDLGGIEASGPGPGPGLLGDFRILREIGRGGMGVVYEAEQISLDRRVALKVLPMAAALDVKQLQRFQLEAHAAACLHHTNIVPVHAVGSERGVPFYAMQFIEGRSLAQVIAELRRLDGLDRADGPRGGLADLSTSTLAADLAGGRMGGAGERDETLPPRESRVRPGPARPASGPETDAAMPRADGCPPSGSSTRSRAYVRTVAQLGVQVAEALDHAHTRGILHRDIKPGNLLLDELGQVWVSDFGLAQVQGHPTLTLTGDILGTLRYMSPEQALARRVVIDGRTDIYSLGVTLYELSTLRPAIEGQDRQEILRKIAESEPAAPRKLNPAVPRDLETILLKAMAKEPSGRYATAKELADELRRFLEHKPILARRPSLLDRAAKWTRRQRPLVASVAAAAVLFLILAVFVLGSSNLRIQKAQRRADEQKERAEANARKAREVVDRMFTRLAQDLAHTPRTEKVRRALLVDALEFYLGFLRENGTNPTLRHEAALAYIKVGDIRHSNPPPQEANAFWAGRNARRQDHEDSSENSHARRKPGTRRSPSCRNSRANSRRSPCTGRTSPTASARWGRDSFRDAATRKASRSTSRRSISGRSSPPTSPGSRTIAGSWRSPTPTRRSPTGSRTCGRTRRNITDRRCTTGRGCAPSSPRHPRIARGWPTSTTGGAISY